jgi:hypothetical protein
LPTFSFLKAFYPLLLGSDRSCNQKLNQHGYAFICDKSGFVIVVSDRTFEKLPVQSFKPKSIIFG